MAMVIIVVSRQTLDIKLLKYYSARDKRHAIRAGKCRAFELSRYPVSGIVRIILRAHAKPGPSSTLRGTWLRSGFDVSTQGFLSVGRADGERKAGGGSGTAIHGSMDAEKRGGLASLASDLANSFLATRYGRNGRDAGILNGQTLENICQRQQNSGRCSSPRLTTAIVPRGGSVERPKSFCFGAARKR
ncbi:hypothetical protein I7I51_09162 [Histoplasma capsulatum]|uniref:Uncharacterized protein n=1 Tax=Ajellomyces capsulatus TaxID=5037 RepID=A0A8A1LZX2_AJECA|nr:hypothetical protein I7I51_09162 [Histoplasma capsulatum]